LQTLLQRLPRLRGELATPLEPVETPFLLGVRHFQVSF
jgi:hypothetical protein